MIENNEQLQEVLNRLRIVEQQNRRFRYGSIALIVLACSLILGAQAAPQNGTVEAERFILRDASGRVSGYWGPSSPPTQPGPIFLLYAEPGKPGAGAQLSVGESGSALRIRDPQGYEAVFGNESLVNPATGTKTQTSAASLLLYGKDGTIAWRTPEP